MPETAFDEGCPVRSGECDIATPPRRTGQRQFDTMPEPEIPKIATQFNFGSSVPDFLA